MGIGGSLFLIAVGAICYWALNVDIAGIEIDTIGIILMVIGGIGLILSLLFWSSFAQNRRRQDTVVTERRDVV